MNVSSRLRQRPPPPPTAVREDCWSEDATDALVEAWGDRYLHLNRGNLRQKDWQDVAHAVNEHQDALGRLRRTDVQCKNRIDTLKKKYKVEKSKREESQWRFFSRLDELIGQPPASALRKHRSPSPPPKKGNPRFGVYSGGSSSRMNSVGESSESSRANGGVGDEEEEEEEDEGLYEVRGMRSNLAFSVPRKRRWDGFGDGGGTVDVFGELAGAIGKFGEIYERVESAKQEQTMDLERQRMEFAKELEFERMQMFMEAQLELEKMKRPKYSSNGKRS